MSAIARLVPSKGSSMRVDADGPYVRFIDHVDALARVEAAGVHLRAAMRTAPLDPAHERMKAELAGLRAENLRLRALLRMPAPGGSEVQGQMRVRGGAK